MCVVIYLDIQKGEMGENDEEDIYISIQNFDHFLDINYWIKQMAKSIYWLKNL